MMSHDAITDLATAAPPSAADYVHLFRRPIARRLMGLHSRKAFETYIRKNALAVVDMPVAARKAGSRKPRSLVTRAEIVRARNGRSFTSDEIIAALIDALHERGVPADEVFL